MIYPTITGPLTPELQAALGEGHTLTVIVPLDLLPDVQSILDHDVDLPATLTELASLRASLTAAGYTPDLPGLIAALDTADGTPPAAAGPYVPPVDVLDRDTLAAWLTAASYAAGHAAPVTGARPADPFWCGTTALDDAVADACWAAYEDTGIEGAKSAFTSAVSMLAGKVDTFGNVADAIVSTLGRTFSVCRKTTAVNATIWKCSQATHSGGADRPLACWTPAELQRSDADVSAESPLDVDLWRYPDSQGKTWHYHVTTAGSPAPDPTAYLVRGAVV